MAETITLELDPTEIEIDDILINPDGSETVIREIWEYEDGENVIEFDVDGDTIGLYLENVYTVRRDGES